MSFACVYRFWSLDVKLSSVSIGVISLSKGVSSEAKIRRYRVGVIITTVSPGLINTFSGFSKANRRSTLRGGLLVVDFGFIIAKSMRASSLNVAPYFKTSAKLFTLSPFN